MVLLSLINYVGMPRKLRFYHSKNSERKKQKVTSSSDLTGASSTDRVSELSSEELCAPSHSSSSVSEEAVSHQVGDELRVLKSSLLPGLTIVQVILKTYFFVESPISLAVLLFHLE